MCSLEKTLDNSNNRSSVLPNIKHRMIGCKAQTENTPITRQDSKISSIERESGNNTLTGIFLYHYFTLFPLKINIISYFLHRLISN